MKTNLLAQNDRMAQETIKQNVGKSAEPLSHSITFPVDVEGAIYPICCIETVPSDSFKISNECLLRQLQPLKVPVMTKYTLNTAYFYCSNRLAWKKWSMFADQANKGRADISYSFEIPTMANYDITVDSKVYRTVANSSPADGDGSGNKYNRNINLKNTIHTYFGISMNRKVTSESRVFDDVNELPLAFPFFDYQIICRDFYTNIDRIPDNPQATSADDPEPFYDFDNPFSDWAFSNLYPVDDDEIKLRDGPQIRSGFVSGDDGTANTKGFVLDKIRYHDLRDDYFTSSKRAPMRGEAPTVDTTIAVTGVDASDVVGDASGDTYNKLLTVTDKGTIEAVEAITQTNLYHASQQPDWTLTNDSQNYSNVNAKGYVSDTANVKLVAALQKLKVSLQTTKAINAAELRLLSQLTVWQELNMLHKPYYNDFLNAHFNNIKVGDSLVEAPQYIGGTSQVIDINEVLQTSESTASSKLGTQAAVAHSLAGSNVGSFFCPDYGFIIGIAYILPDITYRPAMPRWASRRAIEDYYFPEFANLSMQATLNKELFFSNDDDWNNTPLGYVGAYDEMRSIPNRIAGDLLNDSYQDLEAWVLTRKFDNDNKPAINQRFLSAKGNVDMSAWTVPSAPKFMLQVANYITAVRPMPSIAVPKAL